ncbi:MAG: response regulator [Gemmatimonadetes bacterium]|nr:response regulator [Gemmatimonadota bacterium]
MELLTLHATYLERHGYRVLRATDGDSALALARAEHPAVIVIDHSMPGRSGLDVTRELKADPATADIPILLMTAHSYGAIGATARAAGIASFMTKPCQPSRVLREVAAFAPPGGIGRTPSPSA